VCLHETVETSELKKKLGRENESHIFFVEYPFSVSPMAFEGITRDSVCSFPTLYIQQGTVVW
jgi:hypothetical protein